MTSQARVIICLILATSSLVTTAQSGTPSTNGGYVFPIDADPRLMVWEEQHWDGSLAVDIGVHPGFAVGAPERERFYETQTVAVTGGWAQRLDNPRGGTAVLLHGDDGRTYYYAHLASATVASGERIRVHVGEPLGSIGNTGTWSQFLEPHLHLSIANGHQTGTNWVADVNPVWWLERTFGLGPRGPLTTAANRAPEAAIYPDEPPSGLPLFGEPVIVASFGETANENALLAGLRLRGAGSTSNDSSATHPVRAPLTGAVRIHLDTSLGVRLQITNPRAGYSILISGAIEPTVTNGQLAYVDDVIGFTRGEVHYTVFRGGRLVAPELEPERTR
ncbi:MAG: M23 family metallopeptidase [Spirochaetales bacterium]